MLLSDYIENLIGIKDIIVTSVCQTDFELYICFEMKNIKHKCPHCETLTEYIHDYWQQVIKEVSAFGKTTYLHLRKRKYIFKHCAKKFYINTPFLPMYHGMTKKQISSSINEMKSLKSFANRANVSTPTVRRVFKYVKLQSEQAS